MSSQDTRNTIINENLPLLIKELTGFKEDDKNLQRCSNFAWSIIRNHRHLCTSSHDVRRKIQEMRDKFTIDNFSEHGRHLEHLCDNILTHPLCLKHYEVDVHWSLVDFFLAVAQAPTSELRHNMKKIDLEAAMADIARCEAAEWAPVEEDQWQKVLAEDFIPALPRAPSDSDLSDWSEDGVTEEPVVEVPERDETRVPLPPGTLRPPQKCKNYVPFDASMSEEFLLKHVQHSWWLPNATTPNPVESPLREAHFAQEFNDYVKRNSIFPPERAPLLLTERCFLRELIWIFLHMHENKTFEILNGRLRVRDDVTVGSLSTFAFVNTLDSEFLPYVRMCHTLRDFYETFSSDCAPKYTRTYRMYAAAVRSLLGPLDEALFDYDQRLRDPNDQAIHTLLTLQAHLEVPLEKMAALHDVHRRVTVEMDRYPPHIGVAFLMAELSNCAAEATDKRSASVRIALFLAALETFCNIVDVWWRRGVLDDADKEFLLSEESWTFRNLTSLDDDTPVSPQVADVIGHSELLEILEEHCVEAISSLGILQEAKRIQAFRAAHEETYVKIYETLMEAVWKLTADGETEAEVVDTETGEAEVLAQLTLADDFLLAAFSGDEGRRKKRRKAGYRDTLRLMWRLERSKYLDIVTSEVMSTLVVILASRNLIANDYILKLYLDEFKVSRHLGFVRKVLLLEANGLMQNFYGELFQEIEDGTSWANSSHLTALLCDYIGSAFPEMSSYVSVDVDTLPNGQPVKVLSAIDFLSINYKPEEKLPLFFTTENLNVYNRVFRFLLKLKWAVRTLQELRFARAHKRRPPFAALEMVDLLMRRLEQLRFWMMYSIDSIHFHTMTHVLHTSSQDLDRDLLACRDFGHMQATHADYLQKITNQCFLTNELSQLRVGVEQLFNLVFIVRLEWNSCVDYLDRHSQLEVMAESEQNYLENTQIDSIELTYIRCHQYLATKINNAMANSEVDFLSGLADAFNTSLPY